jgi:uncharacterized membrane protein
LLTEVERTGADRVGHVIFVITLLGKGVLGAVQIAAGIAIVLGLARHLPEVAQWLVGAELAADPNDWLARHVIALAHVFPPDEMTFYAIYFLMHGALHLSVVVALLAGVIWAYPAAIATLVGFILYQGAEWVHVGGIVLPVLTLIDVVVIYLTLREWRARQAG